MTLPALLAPGNLPSLCETFEVELIVVTETRQFVAICNSQSFLAAGKICIARVVPMDDLITDVPGDYGMVLTYALFRGFEDLGPRMTDTFLLFFNADFILSDGSLRHLSSLMGEGRRVIHAPSFRVVLEDVWPKLEAMIDPDAPRLCLPSRSMVKLALANKHPTVKARTVNQRICHLSWMDQYYWYVDECTLIGYQSPAALVAIKPERVVAHPATFWDYGFIPQAAPTIEPYFVTDSDDFFMIEPQARDTGRDMIRIGWISLGDLARTESLRTTKEHRASGKQLLKIHSGNLPLDLDSYIQQSSAYMDELYRRLSPTPAHHDDHPLLNAWFKEARERRPGRTSNGRQQYVDNSGESAPELSAMSRLRQFLIRPLRWIYRRSFGLPPQVGKFHPLWVDMTPLVQKVSAWRNIGERHILWVSASETVLGRFLSDRIQPAALLAGKIPNSILEKTPYGACVCELSLQELSNLDELYTKLRPLMRNAGQVIIQVAKWNNVFDVAEPYLKNTNYPSIDLSEIRFFGTFATAIVRSLYMRAMGYCPRRPLLRALAVSATLILLAPMARLANSRAERRDVTRFSASWTSLIIEFTVKRSRGEADANPDERWTVPLDRSANTT